MTRERPREIPHAEERSGLMASAPGRALPTSYPTNKKKLPFTLWYFTKRLLEFLPPFR
jgi:hypothetical protein